MNLHRILALAFASLSLFVGHHSYSQDCAADPCRTVVASVDLLRTASGGYSAAQYAYITVTCYHTSSANSICAGGGDFDRIPVGTSPCNGTDHDNQGTIIRDIPGNCFYRKNFGLNGVVDARQCGVTGDGSTDDTRALNNCLSLAQTYKVGMVSTGGGVVRATLDDIKVVGDVELICGGSLVGSQGATNDYRILDSNGQPVLTNAIVLDPQFTIKLMGRNAIYSKCTLEAGNGNGPEGNPNIYSPSQWYPGCDPDQPPCADTHAPSVRSAMLEASAFTYAPGQAPGAAAGSVGITITGGHATVRDVTVVGFEKCYSLSASPSPVIENLQGDCHTGISIVGADAPQINGYNIHPLLTSSNVGFPMASIGTTGACTSTPTCQYTITTTSSFPLDPGVQNGDVVWIEPTPTKGAESARGYWIVSGLPSGICTGTCTFTLTNSVAPTTTATAIVEVGKIRTATKNGVPATAITEIDPTDASLKFIQIGQTVTDNDNPACFPNPTTVIGVWPAIGVVYLSNPSQCDTAPGTHHFAFKDNAYSGTTDDCKATPSALPPETVPGCIIFDADFRWGDGFYLENSGGSGMVNCHVFEHLFSFHLSTGARSTFATNCATGNEVSLPDRNLGALTSTGAPYGNIISLLIDGNHKTNEDGETDACESDWANSVLGQHRANVIVVQSDCITPTRIANAGMGAAADNGSGVSLEVDAGGVSLANAHVTGPSSVNKAEKATLYQHDPEGSTIGSAELRISDNAMGQTRLNIQDNDAAASVEGCGNVFSAPTPYLCAPSSFTQLPGGRLTLTQGQPVMTSDVAGATTIYYAPYVSQQVPIYSSSTGVFGLTDITPAGLTLSLTPAVHLSQNLYDLFVETKTADGSAELCAGPAWTNSGAGTSARAVEVTQVNGVWVNASAMSCVPSASLPARSCPPYECTWPNVATVQSNARGWRERTLPLPV